MSRLVAFTWGLGLVVATALPAFYTPTADAFPFSTYPMFATPVGKERLLAVEGITSGRERIKIPPLYVANGPVLQAMSTLYQAEAQGPEALRQLCKDIARRSTGVPELASVRRIQIVSASFDPITYFDGEPKAEQRHVLERCPMPGGS